MSALHDLESRFNRVCETLFGELRTGEALTIDFAGESSDFLRFNNGKVRQIGHVYQAEARITYLHNGRTISSAFETSGDDTIAAALATAALNVARRESALLPEDPYQTLPTASDHSRELFPGLLIDPGQIPDEILGPGEVLTRAGADFVGIYAQGAICRGAATSAGARHWFGSETFSVDYSAYLPGGKALKSCYAGREWYSSEYSRRLSAAIPKLEALARSERIIAPGGYRVYLAADAVNELVPFFSWHGLGERGLREGESSYLALRDGRRRLSPLLHLTQDFSLGVEPRFNDLGEVAPETLLLIDGGKLANTLVSARSALQYGVPSNAAPAGEELRSAAIGAGELDEGQALSVLGTGLYISNLHYLNWSDNDSGRVTGMTRFACFWVEDGQIVAPIRDMRFDESIYQLLGDKLLGLTRQRSLIANSGSYFKRDLGGALLPGMLVDDFTFTL